MVERIRRTVETKDGGFDAIEGIMLLFRIECLWMEAFSISCQESHSISEAGSNEEGRPTPVAGDCC